MEAATKLFEAWKAGETDPAKLSIQGWPTWQICYFLDMIYNQGKPVFAQDKLAALQKMYDFEDKNAEIFLRWAKTTIDAGCPNYAAVERFLKWTGKQKFILPIYTELVKTTGGLDFAKKVFAETKDSLHIIEVGYVQDIINGAKPAQ